MREHLVDEDHQKVKCLYCNNEKHLKEWTSEFESELHYKIFICDCGAKTRIRMDFMGSGHDNWDENNPPEMEESEEKGDIEELENLVSEVSKKAA
ncbi:MAG: hypothetical protein QF632_04020 [Candidatus Woesearchaeota archaeon]|jgi:hypothetical protein|nr:hypothetical protein [Candidatus Woesearchaeota archaeon]MDP7323898.1 hypothetical protein [Candidatus Woesearchaeota archaeon]MDP7458231.1 hypothetical protein [Candidatus Woesearchaeota archaeon]|tara:strand:- start:123 stop:407 length:285 start_codon:yes stop_codon:yes gene_type:complete